jgi:hypothetical protein
LSTTSAASQLDTVETVAGREPRAHQLAPVLVESGSKLPRPEGRGIQRGLPF